MKKIETIWHHILYGALEAKEFKWTQQELARQFDYSLSTINHALGVPSNIGAIRKTARFFVLQDFEKLLYYWASLRNLGNDIVYKTFYPGSVLKTEGEIPAGGIYAAYSAARHLLAEAPADYDKIYCYFKDINYFKERFPPNQERAPNIFVLRMPETMPQYGGITTLPQTFVDIWNLNDWYAHEFTKALEEKIHELLY